MENGDISAVEIRLVALEKFDMKRVQESTTPHKLRRTILLLDDGAPKDHSGKPKSKLESFGERLREKEGFSSIAPPMVDSRGFRLQEIGLDGVVDYLLKFVSEREVDGVVLDCDWWGEKFFGPQVWVQAKQNGLAMDSKCVVFMTEFLDSDERAQLVKALDLDDRQVNYKKRDGYDTAAEWLKSNI